MTLYIRIPTGEHLSKFERGSGSNINFQGCVGGLTVRSRNWHRQEKMDCITIKTHSLTLGFPLQRSVTIPSRHTSVQKWDTWPIYPLTN
jgi:hypothetical protein